jgi:O-antigen ligase
MLIIGALVALLPVQINLGESVHIAPSDLMLFLAIGGYAAGFGKFRINRSAWSIWHFGLLLSFAIGSFVALVKYDEIGRYVLFNKDIGLLVLFTIYAVISSFADSWERIRWILKILIISTALQNVVYFMLFLARRNTGLLIPYMDVGDLRLNGMLIDANAYGGMLVLVLASHIVTYYSERPIVGGWLGLFTTVSLTVGVLLTYSRSSWIGVVLLLFLVLAIRPMTGLRLIGLCILVALCMQRFMGPDYAGEMQAMALRDTASDRLTLIDEAIPMYWTSPAFGVGLGTFDRHMGIIIHNTTLWFLVEMGIFGFAWFVGFGCWFLYKGVQGYKMANVANKPIVLGLIASCIAMIGLSMGIEALYQRHWWVVLSLITAVWSAARRDKLAREQGRSTQCA